MTERELNVLAPQFDRIVEQRGDNAKAQGVTMAEFANSLRWFLGRHEAGSLQYQPDEGSFALVSWLDHAIDAPKKCLAAELGKSEAPARRRIRGS
jgi:hypothetical protein